MNLSKSKIEEIACEMALPLKKKANQALNEYTKLIKEKYMASIPEEVKAMFNDPKLNLWLYKETEIRVRNSGYNYSYHPSTRVILNEKVPCCKESYPSVDIENDKDIKQALYKYMELEPKYLELAKEIAQTLLGLRSVAKIRKELPEAIPFLPQEGTTALTVSTKEVRAKLASLNESSAT